MSPTFGPGIIGGVILVDPITGNPYKAVGGGSADWLTILNKPAVVAEGVSQAAARTAIGAGTSNLAIGATGTDAVAGNDSRLTNARTPVAHSHTASDINGGTLAIARIPTGTTSTTVPLGNDSRFSDARTPTAHSHAATDVNSGTLDLARLPDSIPTDERQSSAGVWPSTAASATRRVIWIGYPGNSTPPATTGRPAFVVNVDSYVLRA